MDYETAFLATIAAAPHDRRVGGVDLSCQSLIIVLGHRGAFGKALASSVTFVSNAALKNPAVRKLKLGKPLVAVKNTRKIGKRDMKHNDALPKIEVDSETYVVRADGELLICDPAAELPLAQRYFLF